MISFIVIGRNIQTTATICFNSLFQAVQQAGLTAYEVLYIDSSSTDQTLAIVKGYPAVRIFSIEQNYNAAVARNIGAQEAKGDYLVFLDGDMELQADFLANRLLNAAGQPQHDYVSGDLMNYFYDNNTFQFINKAPYFGNLLEEDKTETVVGGLFAISKKTFQSIGGMRAYYTRCEDFDFGLRLARKKIFLKRLQSVFVNHHTVSYIDMNRMKGMMKNGDFMYVGLLNREHLLNPYFWKVFVRNSYSCITLFCCLSLMPVLGIGAVLPYLLLLSAKSFLQKVSVNHSVFNFSLYFLLRDVQELFGTFFFYPRKDKNPVYKPVLAETVLAELERV